MRYYETSNLYKDNRDLNKVARIPNHDWRFITFLKNYRKTDGKKILDIGCGDGGFLALAREKGFKVYGVDHDRRSAVLAKSLYKIKTVKVGSCKNISRNNTWKGFSVVTLFDVLEHVSNPIDTLKTASGLIKKGGTICISVPRFDRKPILFDIEVDFPPHHFTLWTPQSLEKALSAAGFSDIKIIKKPLMINDFRPHLIWRFKRLLKGSNPTKNTKMTSKGNLSKGISLKRLIKGISLPSTMLADAILKSLKIGRGHTLLALAKK